MPRPRTDPRWVDRIRILLGRDRNMSAVEIWRSLKNLKQLDKTGKLPAGPVPSDRAIRRIKAEFDEVSEDKRRGYEVFSWPESMELDALPWEASRSALDLLRYRAEKGFGPPLVREARWFFQTTMAIPDAPIHERAAIATHLAMREIWPKPNPHPEVLRLVTYQPWRSTEDLQAYKKSAESKPKRHRFAMELTEWTGPFFPELLEGEGSEVIVHFSTGKGKPKGK